MISALSERHNAQVLVDSATVHKGISEPKGDPPWLVGVAALVAVVDRLTSGVWGAFSHHMTVLGIPDPGRSLTTR